MIDLFTVKITTKLSYFLSITICFVIFSCSNDGNSGNSNKTNSKLSGYYAGKGVGPVTEIKIDALDPVMAETGKQIFQSKCISCHQATDAKVIGPGLLHVTKRRTPEWIMNQILNPIEMTQSDSLAKELLSVYLTQMTPMGVTEEEARAVLEYLRSIE
jgi:mono/diheme cytochrome c family protein